jgi:hypothetical protein
MDMMTYGVIVVLEESLLMISSVLNLEMIWKNDSMLQYKTAKIEIHVTVE